MYLVMRKLLEVHSGAFEFSFFITFYVKDMVFAEEVKI